MTEIQNLKFDNKNSSIDDLNVKINYPHAIDLLKYVEEVPLQVLLLPALHD